MRRRNEEKSSKLVKALKYHLQKNGYTPSDWFE